MFDLLTYLVLSFISISLSLIGSIFICIAGIIFLTYWILIKNKAVEHE